MPNQRRTKLILTRVTKQHPSDEATLKGANYIVGRGLNSSRGKKWKFSMGEPQWERAGATRWKATVVVKLNRTGGWASSFDKNWADIVKWATVACQAGNFNKYPWILEANPSPKSLEQEGGKIVPVKDYGKLSLNPSGHFEHIFDREAQVQIIRSALETAVMTDLSKRFHCVLHGPPGCGKTEILTAVGQMLGKEKEAFLMMDATSTTQAGAQRLLMDSAVIPPVLMVEEIEKTDESSLRWLLGLLDHRARIQKINFRIGNQSRNVKMVCLATVNDMPLFKKVMSGALASRFPNKIYCPRPSEEIMRLILLREVRSIKGKEAWIDPTIEYCMKHRKMDDPREIVPVCLCGKDDLLDGSYQAALEKIREPE